MGVSPATHTKNNLQAGTLSQLPPRPLPGDIFIVLPDTADPVQKLAVCFEDDIWTLQNIPVQNPFTIDGNGFLLMNGKIVYIPGTTMTALALTAGQLTFSPPFDISGMTFPTAGASVNNITMILSTAPTVAELSSDNVYAAFSKDGTTPPRFMIDGGVMRSTDIMYVYSSVFVRNTIEDAIAVATAGGPNPARAANINIFPAINIQVQP